MYIIVCIDSRNWSSGAQSYQYRLHGLHMMHLEKLLYRELQRKLHSREKADCKHFVHCTVAVSTCGLVRHYALHLQLST